RRGSSPAARRACAAVRKPALTRRARNGWAPGSWSAAARHCCASSRVMKPRLTGGWGSGSFSERGAGGAGRGVAGLGAGGVVRSGAYMGLDRRGKEYSVLSTPHSVPPIRHSIFHAVYSVLRTAYSILRSRRAPDSFFNTTSCERG